MLSLVSCLSAVFLLSSIATQLVTASPVSSSSSLAFQLQPPTLIPPYQNKASEPNNPAVLLPFNHEEEPASLQPKVLYNTLPPPLVHLFQGLANSISSLGMRLDHHHPNIQKPVDCTNYTIGEILNYTLHHTPKPSSHDGDHPIPLHRLAWLVNLTRPVQEALYNPDADFTLFAPDNDALTPPCKKRRHHQDAAALNPFQASSIDEASHGESTHIFWDALEAIESGKVCPHVGALAEGDDDKSEKKKKFFLHAIEMVLKYHLSPGKKKVHEMLDSSTLPTELPILPNSDAARFRLRVGPAFPHLHKPGQIVLNFFSKLDVLKTRPILAKNGVIYIIEKVPLLPPLSPLSELFLFPKPFSTLTSALQKTHLDDTLLPRWENKSIPLSVESSQPLLPGATLGDNFDDVDERVQSVLSSLTGGHDGKLVKPSFTVFAPTNHAFRSLGPAANAFLFSPFGQHILRYILSFHIVPDVIWHTDHCERAKVGSDSENCGLESETYETNQFPDPIGHHPFPTIPKKVNVTHFHLGTLLGSRKNESLPVTLVKFRHLGKGPIIRRAYIKMVLEKLTSGPPDKHAIPVVIADGVAWGGALHTIPTIVHPPVPEGHHHRRDVQRAIELSILSPA
ncbi:uncharacterized protein VP01_824g1 [Puccinia sorghi]|uniref:FAS1 domain-containing protein n=1 Tax=Puccinia sorghi TaxID=27349 RepID=A0A0L6U9X6_9BASI|nr:uncharacterized protein VP01_824g1 [Puccinia sorghi]